MQQPRPHAAATPPTQPRPHASLGRPWALTAGREGRSLLRRGGQGGWQGGRWCGSC